MFYNSSKRLVNINLGNCTVRALNARKIFRCFSSKADPCKSKPVLLNPDCKTAIITGGVGGIGYATAHQLLYDNAKRIALVGIDAKKGFEAINYLNCSFGKSKAIFFKCDVRNKTEVEDTMKRIKGELGEIDIVVNTAGVWDDKNWQEEMQTNLGGTINVTLAAKDYIQRGNGVIVNLAGFSGLEPFSPSPPFAGFASGIINFSRSFGHDANYKRFGIRTIVLCVGITQTNILNNVPELMLTNELGKDLSDFLKKAYNQKPDACAKAVVEVIKFGPTASVWLIEGSRLFYYGVPDYRPCLNLVSQFV